MNISSISHYVQQNLKTLIYLAIMLASVPLMIIPVNRGFYSSIHYIILMGGIILFFYGLLHLVQNTIFYTVLGAILLFLLVFEIKGDDIFNMKLLSFLGVDIAFSIGFFLLAGIIACIIGIARWRKYD
jgi:hypothetical protein